MTNYVLRFEDIDRSQVTLVGGKGAHLGELSRIAGLHVPSGFCITTSAFDQVVRKAFSVDELLSRLAQLEIGEREAIRELAAEVRGIIEGITMPDDLVAAIVRALAELGEPAAYAVRSSGTAEDSTTASFAGLQDTYLNVVGADAILRRVRHCWASLFSERAVTYRLRSGPDQRNVSMAVVVQQMVFPQASGILFTADPVTGNRKIVSVEATFGLGESLVAGLVNADVYQLQGDEIVTRTIGTKQLAIEASPEGGTRERAVGAERQVRPALTDAQVVRIAQLGRRIEAHFGQPQDIEWCLADEEFQIVQSRPITTLFPIPVTHDRAFHVYISVGHQQMMTDAMKPLGLSFWQMTTPRPMAEAGGRLFVDVTQLLGSPATRDGFLEMAGRSDPLIGDALRIVLDRGFVALLDGDSTSRAPAPAPTPIQTDSAIVADLIARTQASIAKLKRDIQGKSGTTLLEFIFSDIQELRRILFDPTSHQAIMAGMEATWWLNDKMREWLGEQNAADALTQSVPNNVTSEMGLALLDVADVIRPHPEVVAFLQHVENDDFLEALPNVPGGREAQAAIRGWIETYGMRGTGEIDITRPRWTDAPTMLVPILLDNVRNFEPGAAKRRLDRGLETASKKAEELLERLKSLPEGDRKADETRRMIDRVRTFSGFREYPKFGMVSRYFVYKQALLADADRLVTAGVIRDREDIFYLRFEELQEVVRTHRANDQLIRERREAFRWHQTLSPPRVLTSDGEAIMGSYRRDGVPLGALAGLAVSAGVVEGRARVVLDLADADLEAGDILVTTYTDPSWTPLFVAIGGLVTEVGGLMTHGAVIAREYGLPAVVGVVHATRLIQDGQRIRVHGTEGYVEIL